MHCNVKAYPLEAIVIESDIDLIQAYDRRAATYEKLDDLEKSLKDGRLMIKRFPDLVWVRFGDLGSLF